MFELSPTYRRALRIGGYTAIASTLMTLVNILAFLAFPNLSKGYAIFTSGLATMQLAGTQPSVMLATLVFEGLGYHVFYFGIAVGLFVLLRSRWPVGATLLLVAGTWQMLFGVVKEFATFFMFQPLGAAYITGDAALRASLLPIAESYFGLRNALQYMDGSGIAAILIVASLLPAAVGVSRLVRWLGWPIVISVFLSVVPSPVFFVAAVLFPFWSLFLGLWMLRMATRPSKPIMTPAAAADLGSSPR